MNRIRIHVLPSSRGRMVQPVRPIEPQTCSYSHRPCSQPCLDGLEFCIKHVLEDKSAPYKQCSYVSNKNGKRCPNAAPKPEKKEGVAFCAEHTHRNALALQAHLRKASSGPSPELLLSQLSTYGRSNAEVYSVECTDEDSWSDEEQDPVVLDQTWRGDPDSEADSIDSDHDDPLKHAGVYTAEEVALITREKLIRLQSLYIDQFKRLQHLLKEKKRRYLHSRKLEHDAISTDWLVSGVNQRRRVSRTSTLGSSLLTGPEGLSLKERENLRKLKALRRYRYRYGVEALLHRQLRERRQAVTDGLSQAHCLRLSQRCISFVEGTRCSNQCLPMTRHCVSHIYQDSSQVLFRMCPGLKDMPCDRPVHMGQSEEPHCPLHSSLPPPMYRPEEAPLTQSPLLPTPSELYLSTAELQPTENLPLEFSDDLDVVGDGLQCPPSPLLFDTALALEDQTIRAIAEAPMDILTEVESSELDARIPGADILEREQVSADEIFSGRKLTKEPARTAQQNSTQTRTGQWTQDKGVASRI